jgi:low temperature requirement protein LtrA
MARDTAPVGLLIAIGMWWTYFDRLAQDAQRRLRRHRDPVVAATDSFSILHLVIVAGIIVFAGGVRIVVHGSVGTPMSDPGRLAFCGGVALYLVGVAAFRLRLLGEHSPGRLAVAVAMLVLFAVSSGLASWAVTLISALLVISLCAGETLVDYCSPLRREAADSDCNSGR